MRRMISILSEHRPRSSSRCYCGWEGDRFDVHLGDMLAHWMTSYRDMAILINKLQIYVECFEDAEGLETVQFEHAEEMVEAIKYYGRGSQ